MHIRLLPQLIHACPCKPRISPRDIDLEPNEKMEIRNGCATAVKKRCVCLWEEEGGRRGGRRGGFYPTS